jgi:2-amino-4-hydroxy-6-hydroxymethyldihydropteridine diphosphokinase
MISFKNKVFLLLGSNVDPREDYMSQAVSVIADRFGISPVKSSLYESEPWGFQAETFFLNQVVVFETDFCATEIHAITQNIETELGRERKAGDGYASRKMDIDVLYVNDLVLDSEDLVLPHPRLHLRKFTLMPLLEIAPDWVHPVLNDNHRELFEQCNDPGNVWIYQKSA